MCPVIPGQSMVAEQRTARLLFSLDRGHKIGGFCLASVRVRCSRRRFVNYSERALHLYMHTHDGPAAFDVARGTLPHKARSCTTLGRRCEIAGAGFRKTYHGRRRTFNRCAILHLVVLFSFPCLRRGARQSCVPTSPDTVTLPPRLVGVLSRPVYYVKFISAKGSTAIAGFLAKVCDYKSDV